MNNNNNWKNRKSGNNNSGHGVRKGNKNKGMGKNRQNSQRFKGGERNFQKFIDTEHMNYESNYWPQNNYNNDNRTTNYCNYNEPAVNGAIHSWIRNKPANHLIIPQHINFDEQHDQEYIPNNVDPIQHRAPESIEAKKEPLKVINSEIKVPKNDTGAEITKHPSDVHQTAISTTTSNTTVQIKQEKDAVNSSSSSSSSESSSSGDEPEPNIKTNVSVKPEMTSIANPPSSPLNINVKPRNNSVSSKAVNITEKLKRVPESSSSSSSEEDSPLPSALKVEKKLPTVNKSGTKSRKTGSEDDVVCVGNLDNKIVLEDESDNSSIDKESDNETTAKAFNELPKEKKERKSPEKCMICDKNGHTSFQCQMICKNCSAPYHGYRTCPHPANLNTVLQLFIEFCMQQLQNFNVEKQITANNCNNVPKPKVDTSHLASSVSNKSNKLKRKHIKLSESNKKHKKTKKRKTSVSKKTKSKADSDESSSDDSGDDSDADETSSTATDDHISDSSAESLVSSKKKRKLKNLNTSKAAIDLSNLAANSVGLPMVLNGLPHFNVPTTSIQNPNTSANALNTLLLTQMFQNAIVSLKK